ncbi:hypothetical protein OPIT5_03795 [Opitutaceae bacterium TAV5]|nr:hypothetical protein OPIT5_03795 [Opitutaceae bacterium TAV5]
MSYALQLTDAGLAKLATVLDGQRLMLSQIAVGSGVTETPAALAALVHEEYRTDITSRTPVAGGIRVSVVLPENVGGFLVREIGLIDIDGLLIAYGACPAFPKSGAGDGYASAVTLALTLLLTTAQTVQVNILPYASLGIGDVATKVPDLGAYRIKTDETGSYYQLKNGTTGAFHTLYITGAAGAEQLAFGPADNTALPTSPTALVTRDPQGGTYRFRQTLDGGVVYQIKNITTGKFHTIYVSGNAGAETLTFGPAED